MLKNRHYQRHRGLGLIELLATLSILAILIGVAVSVGRSALRKGAMAREVAASRTLITAFHGYAADHDGRYLPGLDKTAGSAMNPVWFEPYKRFITYSEAPHRYPFRLAPYFNYQLPGVIFVNGNEKQIIKSFGKIGGTFSDYGVSLCPALGINRYFVGGYVEPSGNLDHRSQTEALTRQSQADKSLLVFASAGGRADEETMLSGFHEIEPPNAENRIWSAHPWNPEANPGSYGRVDARHSGKAVCVFLDGSVELLGIEELRDMRRWSGNAKQEDNPDYRIKRPL